MPPIVTSRATRALATVELARQRRSRRSFTRRIGLYVATPAVLRYLGIDPATVDPGTDFLADPSVPTDELVIPTSGRGSSSPSRTSRGSTAAGSRSGESDTGRAPARSSRSTVFAATAGSRFRPAGSSSRAALTSEQIAAAATSRRTPVSTIEAQRRAHLIRDADGHRDRRGRPARAGHPRDDGRADPQRERR